MIMQDKNGVFFYKEGNLYQEWYGLPYADVARVVLNGELPVRVR
jgi:hypothetical protein